MRLSTIFSDYKPLEGGTRGKSRFSAISLPLGLQAYPRAICSFVFTLLYILAIFYCYSHYYRDPTSAFWDPTHGYDKAYSLYREAEAEAFIQANNINATHPRTKHFPTKRPSLCLGIATIARPKIQYIQKTVGSVLAGLTPEERDELHFVFFVAHSDPTMHPINGEPWTENLPDTLLSYNTSDTELMDEIKGWETTGNHREKGFYDYTYLMSACQHTYAPYIAMLEGDVLAVPGWLGRSVEAAQKVDMATGWNAEKAAAKGKPSWLYIRMFWTETYLGWNSEEWPTYLGYSFLVWFVVAGSLLGVRHYVPDSRPMLTNGTIGLVSCVWLPMLIMLYFAAGRMSMQPPAPGIRRMENFGCCSQGMIFRREQVPSILQAIEQRVEGYMDMLLETLAVRDQLQRWAIFPSLLQHIGGESSKNDAVADQRAQMIWNFAFERYGDVLESGRKLWR